MGVVFKGGTSGNREDATPPGPSSASSEPVGDTATSGPIPSSIHLQAEHFEQDHYQNSTPDFMPTGATTTTMSGGVLHVLGTPNNAQQDIRGLGPDSGDHSIFKGAPNTGTKGGPG